MSRKTTNKSKATRRKTGRSQVNSAPRTTRYASILWSLLLVAATIFAYQKAWHAGFIWDDEIYVTGNKLLTAPDGLKRIWLSLESPSQYFPLVYTAFRFEHALWGLNPAGYHWVNILLHAANALLVWQLLRLLRVPGAWLAGALFALHPVQVESVAWITERKNVLMGFFFLLALLAWTAFVENRANAKWRWYALALVCYALALFSKTTACTMPAALLLILWLKYLPITWRRWAEITPFVVLGIAMGIVTIWWERYHQGTQGELFSIGLPERFLIASHAIWFYLGKLIWPAHLSFSYPHWNASVADAGSYIWALATLLLAGTIIFVRRYIGRSVEVAALFFVTTLGPVLGFVMLYTFRYSFVADHYQYLACIGPFALAAAGVTIAFDRLGRNQQLVRPIVYGAVLLLLGFRTWQQCGVYFDLESLWRSTIAENPDSWMAHNNLGIRLVQTGRVAEAIPHYNKALELNPRYAEAHYNLGNALVRSGRPNEAIERYHRALELEPRMASAHSNLAALAMRSGQVSDAIAHYNKALQIAESNAAVHNQLGTALVQEHRVDEAVTHFRRALVLNPDFVEAHYNLGNAMLQLGRSDEALDHFREAVRLNPEYAAAHNNLANVLVRLGQFDEAVAHYHRALEINPQYAAAHNNLGKTLRQMGREDEALAHLRRAAELDSGPQEGR